MLRKLGREGSDWSCIYTIFYCIDQLIVILNNSTLQLLDSQGRWAGVKKIDMIAANTPVFPYLQPLLPPYPSPCPSLLCYDPSLIQIGLGRKTENHYCGSAACFKKSTQSFDRFVLQKVDPDGSMKYELEEEEHFRSR